MLTLRRPLPSTLATRPEAARRPPVRTAARTTARAAGLALALALAVTGCTGGDDEAEAGVDPSTQDWPAAVDPATAEGDVWVVWTAVAEDGDQAAVDAAVAELRTAGYADAAPLDPACQEGTAELLGAMGFDEPTAVGLAFASAEDAGVFDTRFAGTTVSLTSGPWTCA
ncbi:hypothetical protein [Cellulomonas oligotrophica]|uniref:Uncharacterized protein n=1 Tax=Cellulomonas oligotrophica TaxID=931536 RepID=A0A7Y9FE52_9CELL|nr:hypothetical protein [Cellulomonas oligotrophica]NYD85544.1 hypothetical protein [Cellulomonas oligotrophica]GIG31447.1 hypothetical protein Col01nite_06060 [Cellulomonas oligotrophica]